MNFKFYPITLSHAFLRGMSFMEDTGNQPTRSDIVWVELEFTLLLE